MSGIPFMYHGPSVAEACLGHVLSMANIGNLELLEELRHAQREGRSGDSLALLVEYATRRGVGQVHSQAECWLSRATAIRRAQMLADALAMLLLARTPPPPPPHPPASAEPPEQPPAPDDAPEPLTTLQRRLGGVAA